MAMTVSERLAHVLGKGEKALITYVTAGDPELDQLPAILETLTEAGADVIEVGVAYSDPIGDGPTIQASTQRALERGVNSTKVLETLAGCELKVPVVLMGYYNTLLRNGLDSFAGRAFESGVKGTIMVDLIPEEADDWIKASRDSGLETVFLAAPTSTDARLKAVSDASTGFVYAVSRTGVTGARAEGANQAESLVSRLKGMTDKPVCVGFGISNPDHVRQVCDHADGAVVGSWLVTLLAEQWNSGAGRQMVLDKVSALKAATRG